MLFLLPILINKASFVRLCNHAQYQASEFGWRDLRGGRGDCKGVCHHQDHVGGSRDG